MFRAGFHTSKIWPYSLTNSTGATQDFFANRKTSSEQKNRSSFISDQSPMTAKKQRESGSRRDAFIYGEILFIFILKGKWIFSEWRPKNVAQTD